jgi:hypothetical protein
MRKIGVLVLAAAAALLGGCGDGETYPLAAKDVKADLLSIKPPNLVFGDGIGVETMASQIGQDQVRWTVRSDGTSMLKFTATVTPDGDKASKVALTVEPFEGQERDQIRHNVATTSAALNLYHAAMVEQIDARLENRSFNYAAIQSQMLASMGTAMKQIDASFDDAVKNFDAQDREHESWLEDQREAKQNQEIESASRGSGEASTEGSYEE